MPLHRVQYQIATYEGIVCVNAEVGADDETIIAKAKRILRQQTGPLPFGVQSWKVLPRGERR